jgi:hypothetical protein
MDKDEHEYDPSLEYNPNTQVHAAYVLHHLQNATPLQQGVVHHMYQASTHRYDLSSFTPSPNCSGE